MANYNLFLFDLDDTLLDFKASERLSFTAALNFYGVSTGLDSLFASYQKENHALWREFERGEVSKDFLKVERFARSLRQHNLDMDAQALSDQYLQHLPKTVVLLEGAVDLCRWLAELGEIGVITNGIDLVQRERIKNSPLSSYISFICVSEACGFAKPDVRFFDHAVKMAKNYSREKTLVVGDRLDTDILGAQRFGVDACWLNPGNLPLQDSPAPKFEIRKLPELRPLLSQV